MHILLLGKNGQLGWELHRALAPLGYITALDYPEIDLASPDPIRKIILEVQPDIIVNTTAYTAVDRAETEPEIAQVINGYAPGWLAEMAKEKRATLVHYSTDYVFDGTTDRPYLETDTTHPINEYGRSKLAGETAISQVAGSHLIFRTSWVYSLRRDSFVTKVLGWSRQQKVMKVVADQTSNPTWARMLAEASAQVLAMGGRQISNWVNERKGLYHLAGDGFATRLEWAQAILRFDSQAAAQVVEKIEAAQTADFPTPAQRPLFSALNCDLFASTFGLRLPPWEFALQLAMQAG